MTPFRPFRGNEDDVGRATAKLKERGFRVRTSIGPDNQPFGNMFVQLENGKIRANVVMDRNDATLDIGPIGNDALTYRPTEWLIVGGSPPPEVTVGIDAETELLCSQLETICEIIMEISSHPGVQEELREARRQVNDNIRAMNPNDSSD